MGFWIVFTITGMILISRSGLSLNTQTCPNGDVVKKNQPCPECKLESDCFEKGPDFVCDTKNSKCVARFCMSIADCRDDLSICEYNKCVNEKEFAEQQFEEAGFEE